MTKKKWKSIRLFLYVAPFIALVIIFSYYPLYGWIYAFYDYRPPKPFSEAQFVGLKWFKSLVENDVKIKQIVQVLKYICDECVNTWYIMASNAVCCIFK